MGHNDDVVFCHPEDDLAWGLPRTERLRINKLRFRHKRGEAPGTRIPRKLAVAPLWPSPAVLFLNRTMPAERRGKYILMLRICLQAG